MKMKNYKPRDFIHIRLYEQDFFAIHISFSCNCSFKECYSKILLFQNNKIRIAEVGAENIISRIEDLTEWVQHYRLE